MQTILLHVFILHKMQWNPGFEAKFRQLLYCLCPHTATHQLLFCSTWTSTICAETSGPSCVTDRNTSSNVYVSVYNVEMSLPLSKSTSCRAIYLWSKYARFVITQWLFRRDAVNLFHISDRSKYVGHLWSCLFDFCRSVHSMPRVRHVYTASIVIL